MNQVQLLSSLETLAQQYDCFVFDVYGVFYDGVALIDSIINFINYLRKKDKVIAFLSNSQRLPQLVLNELKSHDFSLNRGEELFTSGGYFRKFLNDNADFRDKNTFYHLGKIANIDNLDIKLTSDIKKASCIIITFCTTEFEEIAHCKAILKAAFEQGCSSICFNPDITAPHGGNIMYTPGYIAKQYEELGGKVMYFGKPHKGIYEFFIDQFMKVNGKTKQNTIAVGDSVSTDIRGAINFGIDSLLLFSKKRSKQSSFNSDICAKPTYAFELI